MDIAVENCRSRSLTARWRSPPQRLAHLGGTRPSRPSEPSQSAFLIASPGYRFASRFAALTIRLEAYELACERLEPDRGGLTMIGTIRPPFLEAGARKRRGSPDGDDRTLRHAGDAAHLEMKSLEYPFRHVRAGDRFAILTDDRWTAHLAGHDGLPPRARRLRWPMSLPEARLPLRRPLAARGWSRQGSGRGDRAHHHGAQQRNAGPAPNPLRRRRQGQDADLALGGDEPRRS